MNARIELLIEILTLLAVFGFVAELISWSAP